MTQIVFVDIESTGLEAALHGIVELGAIFHGSSVSMARWAVNPGECFIDPKALEVNGFLERDIRQAPYIDDVIREFDHRVEDKAVLAGWNVPFDVGFIKHAYYIAGVNWRFDYHTLDVWSLYYTLIQAGVLEGPLHLEGLIDKLGLRQPEDGRAHGALQDITWTYRLWKEAIRRYISKHQDRRPYAFR